MKIKLTTLIKIIPPFILLLLTELLKRQQTWIRYYSEILSPRISESLNHFSSLFNFSLFDLTIVVTLLIIVGSFFGFIKKEFRKKSAWLLLYTISILYAAFYFSWGYNYYSDGFLKRNEIKEIQADSVQYEQFVSHYITELNRHYVKPQKYSDREIDSILQLSARKLQQEYAYPHFRIIGNVKHITFGRCYAGMGVLGYYGPFWGEVHINPFYHAHEHASIQAHERAHLNGITNEADANLYAYLLTTRSENPQMQFSGYYSILGHILRERRLHLNREQYQMLVERIDPRIRQLYESSQNDWRELYWPFIGRIQKWFYNLFLKGNQIDNGIKNYSDVIKRIISIEKYDNKERPDTANS